MKTPILFTDQKSNFHKLTAVDCYGIERNALNYTGLSPVIAMPPCRLWSRMRRFSTAPACERFLGIWAISLVRRVGGVVEQPAGSKLFTFMNIPLDGSPDKYGGFIRSLDQNWFGFKARKRTYLYIVGVHPRDIPALPLPVSPYTHSLGKSKHLLQLDKKLYSRMPIALCHWLILLVSKISMPNSPNSL